MELSTNEAITQAILAGLGVSILSRYTLGLDTGADEARLPRCRGVSARAPLVFRLSDRQAAAGGGAGVHGLRAVEAKSLVLDFLAEPALTLLPRPQNPRAAHVSAASLVLDPVRAPIDDGGISAASMQRIRIVLDACSDEYVADMVRRSTQSQRYHYLQKSAEGAWMTEVVATNQTILVVGGGISGMTAALEAAECGKDVVLVEKTPTLGGRTALLYRYFPKLCHPTCGLEINLRRIKSNRNCAC